MASSGEPGGGAPRAVGVPTVSLPKGGGAIRGIDDARRLVVETRTEDTDGAGFPARLVRYQLDNHLGSACLDLDDHGDLVSYEEYHPFGSTAFQAVRVQLPTPKRYRYTGTERDE